LGSLPRRRVAEQIAHLSRDDRKALRETGMRIGRESVWVPALVKPAAAALRGLLWAVHAGVPMPPMPPDGRMSVPLDESVPRAFYEVVGYRPLGPLAVRIDIVERLAAKAFALSRTGPFAAGPELVTLCGCGAAEIAGVLSALGYRSRETEDGVVFFPAPKKKNQEGVPRQTAAAPSAEEGARRRSRFPVRQAARARHVAMTEERLRLDKWLWFARFFKSRSLAQKLCESGRLRINGQVVRKTHQTIKPDNVLTFPKGRDIRVIRVVALGTRRGPAPEAQTLYEDLERPQPRAASGTTEPTAVAGREPGSGRPTKADRRAIDRLRGEDEET